MSSGMQKERAAVRSEAAVPVEQHGSKHVPTSLRRFSLARVIEHQVVALIFIALAVTGLVQKFHSAEWAQGLVAACGGIDTVRLVHRWCGVAFAASLFVHIFVGLYLVIVRHVQASMMVSTKDFVDAMHNLRFYFGIQDHPARCDRYDYKQKFEYWGVVLGGILMAGTGVILWFPMEIFSLVPWLPGQIVPAAKMAHTNEAMLAVIIIVMWHIYNAVFSPEVFPLDTAVFTGRISAARMRHEHPLEYERITGQSASHDDHTSASSGESGGVANAASDAHKGTESGTTAPRGAPLTQAGDDEPHEGGKGAIKGAPGARLPKLQGEST